MPDPQLAGAVVVVPVYGAAEALERCLASLQSHTDFSRHRLILVADGPQPPPVAALLDRVASLPGIQLLALPSRRGFVGSTNHGLAAAPGSDVILLNSDTQVTAGWVEKLAAAAHSSPNVASVTPFSNSATICSLPRTLDANALPAGFTLESFSTLVEHASVREYPRLPTGVGVCMYVRAAALAAVGALDEKGFGLGYGEEVDWCLRARAAGFVHVLDDATFIFHEGQSSFGSSSRERGVRAGHREITRRYPGYLAEIAQFMREDSLRTARQRVSTAMAEARRFTVAHSPKPATGPRSVLHVVHGWPPWSRAGTETYAAGLVERQARHRDVSVLARRADPRRTLGEPLEYDFHGARVRLLVNNFTQRDPLSRNALRERRFERELERMIDESRPELVHVHHLAGLCATLPRVAAKRGIPVVYQLQDWWALCARANLFDRAGQLCAGPGLRKCSQCLPLTGLPGASVSNPLLYSRRNRLLREALRSASLLIAGSSAIVESYRGLGWLRAGDRVEILPYGVEPAAFVPRRGPAGLPLRFGFIGAAMPHKGLHVATAAFAGIDPGRACLQVWGSTEATPEYALRALSAGGAAVEARGPFASEDIEQVFAGFDVLIVPSLGLESFGLVAREAMLRGVPVLASRRGALPEMFPADRECGATFDPENADELRNWIETLTRDPSRVDGWRAAIPCILTMNEHADQIEGLYERVVGGRAVDKTQ